MPEDSEAHLEAIPSGTGLRVVAVILGALFLALTLVWLLSGGGTQIFDKKTHLHAYLSDGSGLEKDADVRLNGVAVGKTTNVRLSGIHDRNRAVRLDMKIDRKFTSRVPVDSIAAVTADNLLGDKYVNITAGKSLRHVEEDTEIASLIASGQFDPADLISSLRTTLTRVDAIITEIDEGNTPLAQFVRGDEFYTSLQTQVGAIQKTLAAMTAKKSATGAALFGMEPYNRIRQPILNIDRMLEQMQRGENDAGRLLTSSASYDNAVAKIRKIHQSILNAQTGKSGEFLTSDARYRQIQNDLATLNHRIDQLTTGNQGFAKYLQSRELYDSLEKQGRQSRVFLREFRLNPQKYLRVKPFGGKSKK